MLPNTAASGKEFSGRPRMDEIAAAISGASERVAPVYAVVRNLDFLSVVTLGLRVEPFVIVKILIMSSNKIN